MCRPRFSVMSRPLGIFISRAWTKRINQKGDIVWGKEEVARRQWYMSWTFEWDVFFFLIQFNLTTFLLTCAVILNILSTKVMWSYHTMLYLTTKERPFKMFYAVNLMFLVDIDTPLWHRDNFLWGREQSKSRSYFWHDWWIKRDFPYSWVCIKIKSCQAIQLSGDTKGDKKGWSCV